MKINPFKTIQGILKKTGVQFETGLNDEELHQIELKYNFIFPPDLKSFLKIGLPVSERFVNWRMGLNVKDYSELIVNRLNWPLEGMLFDIQNNNFWPDEWGPQTKITEKRLELAKQKFLTLPKLIPIYSHRYIPAEPNITGNPVFSVYQMDIIYYGFNLASYLANEFHFELPDDFLIPDAPREIAFWSKWSS